MRFVYDGKSEITCLPDSALENFGENSQGRRLKLINHNLYFETEAQIRPHSDLLALICLIVFYPFLKNPGKQLSRIIFPDNVSQQFKKVIDLHFGQNNGLEINYDLELESYQGDPESITLSWGGGLDSWAVYKLQPEIYRVLIHEEQKEAPIPSNKLINLNRELRRVRNNQRELAEIITEKVSEDVVDDLFTGWTNWVGVLVSSIWLASEYQTGVISLGGNLGSVFLNNGTRYSPAHLRPNKWFETLRLIGIELYLPLAGLTDLGVIKIVGREIDQVKYCWRSDSDGNNCHQCLKCRRKEVLLGRDYGTDLSQGLPKWKALDFNGPSFDYVLRGGDDLEKWVKKYYGPALELVRNEKLRNHLILALRKKGIQILEEENEYLVEHYGFDQQK